MDQISPLGLYPNDHPMKITGIYDSGFYEYDRSLIICNLNDAREIISLPEGFSNLEIKLKPEYLDGVEDLAYNYGKLLGRDMSATGVANTQLLRIVRMQKWLIFIVFSFLLLIAGINVISAVSTLIYDKKNEIAVLKTLGASSGTIKRLLYYQVAFVCLASILIGQLFGYILSWLVVHQRFYQLKGEVYFINRLELYVSPLNQLVIFLVAAVVAILCIRIPLRRIDRMFIIDLLRNP
jgi:lipoprotein-releasing system permease protein